MTADDAVDAVDAADASGNGTQSNQYSVLDVIVPSALALLSSGLTRQQKQKQKQKPTAESDNRRALGYLQLCDSQLVVGIGLLVGAVLSRLVHLTATASCKQRSGFCQNRS